MKVETRQPFWYNGFTTNPSTSRKETSPHGKIIPDLLPEMQQPSKLLSLRQRPTWEPEISLPRMRASVCAGCPFGRQARETAHSFLSDLPCLREGHVSPPRPQILLKLPVQLCKYYIYTTR